VRELDVISILVAGESKGGHGSAVSLPENNRPLAKKICVILKSLLKFRSNFELLVDWHLLKLAQPARL
jgi:hypothetical protein